jgi:hypothetical protein
MVRRISSPTQYVSCFIPLILVAVHDKHIVLRLMRHYTIALLTSLWFGILINCFGQGAVLIEHSGALDPTAEGFTPDTFYGSVGPVTNDLGMNAWTTTSGGPTLNYYQLLTPQQQAQVDGSDWKLSVTLRVVQSSGSSDIYTTFATGSQFFSLGFGLDGGGDPFVQAGDSSLSPVYTLTGAGSIK